jgi:hypothetical protein
VEALLHDWRRIPFTCSYMPGKHTVAQFTLVAMGMYMIVSTVGWGMEMASLRQPSLAPGVVIVAVLAVFVLALRRWRQAKWREMSLTFDDELPSDVQVFRLDR